MLFQSLSVARMEGEEVGERLGVQLALVADEAASLQGEVGELAAELRGLRTQVGVFKLFDLMI